MTGESKLDETLAPFVESGRIVGIAAGFLSGESSLVRTYGRSGIDVPLDSDSVLDIGSVTKTFTGVLLATMVNDKMVAYEDPIRLYLPTEVTTPTKGDREITLLDLATHTSTLPRLPPNLRGPGYDDKNPYAHYTVDHLYEALRSAQIGPSIGIAVGYSNYGFGLLGHVLARASGQSYEDLVVERVCKPLGLSDTVITLREDMRARRPRGHNSDGEVVPGWDLPTLAGAGALRSTVNDMLAFLRANLDPESTPIGGALRDAHYPIRGMGRQGLGWIVSGGEHPLVWHNGGTGGFHSFLAFRPDTRSGIVALTNSHGIDAFDAACARLLR